VFLILVMHGANMKTLSGEFHTITKQEVKSEVCNIPRNNHSYFISFVKTFIVTHTYLVHQHFILFVTTFGL